MNKVTDTRPPFFLVEDSVVTDYDLNPNEGWLYIVILKHANRKTGEAFPSVQTLAKEAHMSKATVLRTTKSLEAKGLIRVSREGNLTGKARPVNHYWILMATPVSDSNRPGITQQPTPVSDVDQNQNHSEPEKDSPDGEADSTAQGKKSGKPRPPHKNAPWHDALLRCFRLTPETVSKTADRSYWIAAADLAGINFPVDKIQALYDWCDDQDWPNFSVMALAKYAGEWLAKQGDDDDDPYAKLEIY